MIMTGLPPSTIASPSILRRQRLSKSMTMPVSGISRIVSASPQSEVTVPTASAGMSSYAAPGIKITQKACPPASLAAASFFSSGFSSTISISKISPVFTFLALIFLLLQSAYCTRSYS